MPDRPAVLLVDHDDLALKQTSAILSEDFEVEICVSPEFALRRAQQRSFDVVCSEFAMPEMNGIELLERISHVDPRCEQLLVTGAKDLFLRALAIEPPGRICYLFKPYRPDALRLMTARLARVASAKAAPVRSSWDPH